MKKRKRLISRIKEVYSRELMVEGGAAVTAYV
jgi:hypothetical protein